MAEKDITGRAADNVARILLGATARVKKAVPYGPGRMQMTPSELRARMQRASPASMQQLIKQLGPEEAMKLLMNTKDSVGVLGPEEYFDRGMK